MSRLVSVPPVRLRRWLENFERSHGESRPEVHDGLVWGRAPDGSTYRMTLPFGRLAPDPPTVPDLLAAAAPPASWGVLLVRKGGFAVARLRHDAVVDTKTGQRHVQGRTKAGGQSQQRFARRRQQQARVAYEAAAGHASRILGTHLDALVVGGDATAVDAVLADPRLTGLRERVVGDPLPVPDPRRSVLEEAIRDAGSFTVRVENA